MSNKHKNLYKNAVIRSIVFGCLFVIFIASSVVGLVQNSREAKDRYDTLIAVDKAGGDVDTALNNLRGYMYSHMNTKIGNDNGIRPPIQLQGTYERLLLAEKNRVTQVNESLYAAAQAYCERTLPAGLSGSSRLKCIEEYVDTSGEKVQEIDASFYKFDFVSPRWSPDFAGISIVVACIFGAVFVIDLILFFRIRRLVHMTK